MNIESLYVSFGAFALVVSGLVKLLLIQHEKRLDEKFAALTKERTEQQKSITDLDTRVTRIEASSATHKDMVELKTDVAALKSETSGQTELLQRLTNQVDRINQWLINKAK